MELLIRNDLNTELSQKLMLTQEMLQSLDILQYSREELVEHVYDMMMENPVIDMEEPEYIESVSTEEFFRAESPVEQETFSAENENWEQGYVWELDEWHTYAGMTEYDEEGYYGRYSYDTQNGDRLEYSAVSDITLEETLLSQVEETGAPYLQRAVAAYIIQTLDENGYMTCTVQEIARELCISDDVAMDGLRLVWTLEPAGVGARDLAECLELQLKNQKQYNEIFEKLLQEHLEDIALNRLSAVAKAIGISVYKMQDYADVLRSLEPKPGRLYAAAQSTHYIVPDVLVEQTPEGYQAVMHKSATPKIIIRREYRDMLEKAERGSGVASFLSGRFRSAMQLVKNIEQRSSTILRVTNAILRHQEAFFENGRDALKPLTMKEIAEELEINESTVSRAVNQKYLQSSQGVYELRFFFTGTGRLNAADGSTASSESMKGLIRRLVDAEDRTTPMSDRSIAEAIMVTGVNISRRTVAKYREELGIPASSVRRRLRAE